MAQVILRKGKAKPFFHGEPLVFSGAVGRVEGAPRPADLVQVFSIEHQYVGAGVFNPHSDYRVRLLSFGRERIPAALPEIIRYRLQQAVARRRRLDLPGANTDVYRLVNSEADGLSGLTVDVFAGRAVAAVTAYWLMAHRELVLASLAEAGFAPVLWRPHAKALAQDGWCLAPAPESDAETLVVRENGLLFEVEPGGGQKTGFYCDQRENRMLVRHLAANRRVLDCCCYSGGFALNAALGGASQVLGVDSSAPAIERAQRNARLNNLDIATFANRTAEDCLCEAEGFDFIILDPPKLAPTRRSLARAEQRYIKLNALALAALPARGTLLSFSCSDAVSPALLRAIIESAAARVGRTVTITRTFKAAPDHPYLANARYGNYLKGCLVEVG